MIIESRVSKDIVGSHNMSCYRIVTHDDGSKTYYLKQKLKEQGRGFTADIAHKLACVACGKESISYSESLGELRCPLHGKECKNEEAQE